MESNEEDKNYGNKKKRSFRHQAKAAPKTETVKQKLRQLQQRLKQKLR
ncbi:MAG: hypothetical protein ACLUD2_06490 [Clostridium sp.]